MTVDTARSAPLEMECYPMTSQPPDLAPGRQSRNWMDAFASRHPYRCLPLNMANTTGWEILCPYAFTADWTGGERQEDITIKPDRPVPDLKAFVVSHFSRGVLTMHPQYLFRTPPGWDLMVSGSPNHVKDGIQPLVGLVETDWLPFPFTMNWIFTRPSSSVKISSPGGPTMIAVCGPAMVGLGVLSCGRNGIFLRTQLKVLK